MGKKGDLKLDNRKLEKHCLVNQIKSNHFYCHITTAQVPWWVKFLRPCSRQCRKTTDNLHMDRQCKKKQQTIYIWTDSAKKTALEHLQCSRQCKKNNNNLHMDSTYLQTVQKTMCKIHIHILSTQCTIKTHSIISDTLYTVWAHLHYVHYLYIM